MKILVGFVKWVLVLLVVAVIYELSFNFFVYRFNKQATNYALDKIDSLLAATNKTLTPKEKDSLQKVYESEYIENHQDEAIYPIFGFSYRQCLKKSMTMGMDLQGGLNIVVNVDAKQLLIRMSANPSDTFFQRTLELADNFYHNKGGSYIDRFAEAWNTLYPQERLASIFSTRQTRDKLPLTASNDEVLNYIKKIYNESFDIALRTIRTRVDKFGVVQPNIQRITGTDKIMLELPGVKNPERIRKILQAAGYLEFWETFLNGETYPLLNTINEELGKILSFDKKTDTIQKTDTLPADTGKTHANPLFSLLMPNVYYDASRGGYFTAPGPIVGYAKIKDTSKINALLNHPTISDLRKIKGAKVKFLWGAKPLEGTQDVLPLYAIKVLSRDEKPPLDGSVITDAYRDADPYGNPEVAMTMNAEGASIWYNLTKENVGKYIAIALDNMIYSAPMVKTPISGGRSSITGHFTVDEAEDLANILKSGRLPISLSIARENFMGPTLGEKSLKESLIAFIVSLIAIGLIMVAYYGTAGIAAFIALLLNLFLLIGTLDSLGATLTLPSIAGIILTIGMAVDANIIIFERIKESLREGNGPHIALDDGITNSLSAIIDANLTTIIAAIIMYTLTTGPLQNFAVTLIAGNILTIITQVFLPNILLRYALEKKLPLTFATKFSQNLFTNVKIPWMKYARKFFLVSLIINATLIIVIIIRKFDLGIDFTGGHSLITATSKTISTEEIKKLLTNHFIDEKGQKYIPEVKTFGDNLTFKITTDYLIDKEPQIASQEIIKKVNDAFSSIGIQANILSIETVGPAIASDVIRDSIIAIILAFILMFLYIFFRFAFWQFALGAIFALFHDAIIVLGIFSALYNIIPINLEIDQVFVGALLTVLGYSINDTVIVYDRIRFRMRLFKNESLYDLINNGINSTLGRTIMTSLTTIIVLLIILLLGGETTKSFALGILIGTITGTYSSFGIAASLGYLLISRKSTPKMHSPSPTK